MLKVGTIEEDQPADGAARAATAGSLLAMLLAALGTSIANVALPDLAAAFDAPLASVQWVVTCYLLAITAGIVIAGRLGDMFGHRRALVFGVVLFVLSGVVAALAPGLAVLIAARAMQGLGASLMLALPAAHLRAITPKNRLGAAMGLLGTASAVGTALGPALGGVVIGAASWRAAFVLTSALGIVALALLARGPGPVAAKAAKAGLDLPGALLLALGATAYALAFSRAEGRDTVLLLAVSGIAFWAFLRVEAKAPAPLVDPMALREPGLVAGMLMNALVATVMMATLIAGPVYLARALGLPVGQIGLVLAVGPVLSALTGFPSGRLVDRFGTRTVMTAGLAAAAIGALGLAVLPMAFGLAGYLAAIAVLTPGYQLFQAANTTEALAVAAVDRRGVISALLGLARNLGLVSGAAGLGGLFAWIAEPGGAAAVTSALQVTFAVAAVLAAMALAIALRPRRG